MSELFITVKHAASGKRAILSENTRNPLDGLKDSVMKRTVPEVVSTARG